MNLIDKDVLVAEIERLRESNEQEEDKDYAQFEFDVSCGYDMALDDVEKFINTIEVKEVDLEKEIDNQIRLLGGVHTLESGTNWYKGPYSELVFFAKHFFELGLKAQKGE